MAGDVGMSGWDQRVFGTKAICWRKTLDILLSCDGGWTDADVLLDEGMRACELLGHPILLRTAKNYIGELKRTGLIECRKKRNVNVRRWRISPSNDGGVDETWLECTDWGLTYKKWRIW